MRGQMRAPARLNARTCLLEGRVRAFEPPSAELLRSEVEGRRGGLVATSIDVLGSEVLRSEVRVGRGGRAEKRWPLRSEGDTPLGPTWLPASSWYTSWVRTHRPPPELQRFATCEGALWWGMMDHCRTPSFCWAAT
eukprot:358505-Chlamydomonas_euryale.AAC.3